MVSSGSGIRRSKGENQVTPKKTKTEKKTKPLSEGEIFALAEQYEQAHADAATAEATKKKSKDQLIAELHERRKVRAVESAEYGRFTRITVVTPESVEYDGPALYKDCTPAQRREAFDRNVNLNALSPDARKRVLAVLTKEELRAVTTNTLNVDRLSAAVQAQKVPAELVAKHSEIKKKAPYISISHGSGD
jgi:hypothetical protein